MKELRAPIVTVLGHVDHGKTTLLDVIRKSNKAAKEVGGITQSIGAGQVKTKEGEFTFVDTPGHAAFAKMRERGAKLADIALLVVSSAEGIKPQTIEAIKYIKEAELPFIVVATKTDLPSSNIEKTRAQLEENGILFEGRGGDVPLVSVSAKNNEGIEGLLEMIGLVASVNEITADSEGELSAVVIEVNKDQRGVVVSVVVRDGKLQVGNDIVANKVKGRVKGMFDEFGKSVKQALPGEPVVVLGFAEMPEVGAEVGGVSKGTSADVESNQAGQRKDIPEVGEGEVPVVVKAGSTGSLEAILASIPKGVVVVLGGVGDVNDSDVAFAKSAKARILVFEAKVSGQVKKLADTDDVVIEEYKIIYELIKSLEEILTGKQGKIKGKATIVQIFPFGNKKVAGCRVEMGEIAMGLKLKLMREDKEVGEGKVVSLRREKHEITLAKAGEECGIILAPNLDFSPGDVLLSVESK